MSSFSTYDVSVGLWLRALKTLKHVLTVASAHSDAANFPDARLVEDMRPLTFQVQVVSNGAKSGVQQLTGQPQPSWADDETTLEQLIARVDKTVTLLESVDLAALEGAESREVEIKTAKGAVKFDGKGYVLSYGIPNFMFHLITAYAILRAKGVQIGKFDYISEFIGPYRQ